MKLTTIICGLLLTAAVASAQYANPVREVDVPAKKAFVLPFFCTTAGAPCTLTPPYAGTVIPANHRFVIEHMSARLMADSPTTTLEVSVQTWHGSIHTAYFFSPTVVATDPTIRSYNGMVSLYTDSVPLVKVMTGALANNLTTQTVVLTGYLVAK